MFSVSNVRRVDEQTTVYTVITEVNRRQYIVADVTVQLVGPAELGQSNVEYAWTTGSDRDRVRVDAAIKHYREWAATKDAK